jgi:hypothetical protein
MTTQVCELVAYGETAGAPLCVCSLASAQAWQGAEHDQTRYWEVVEGMDHAALFQSFNQTVVQVNSMAKQTAVG